MLIDEIKEFRKDYKGIPRKEYIQTLRYSCLRFKMECFNFIKVKGHNFGLCINIF